MKLEQLRNKSIVIVGYGREGHATEQYLRQYLPDAKVEIIDETDGEYYLQNQGKYDIIIKTPGIQKKLITNAHTTATNIFFANVGDHPIIGVTGSKGKSTTASLIYHILKHAGISTRLVGNIGNPALSELLDPPTEKTWFVYELSSYQLDDINYSPHISVVVSLFPEHMTYHGSVEEYYQAKQNIIRYAQKKDYYVYNPLFSQLKLWATSTQAKAIPFEEDYIPEHIPLLGKHNKENVRGAITAARLLKIPDTFSAKAIANFKPLPHRLEKVGTFQNITFYDDAISTTPESTIAALESIENVQTLLLGGENRGYDYSQLATIIHKKNIQNIVLFPESGEAILEELKKSMPTLPRILQTDTMKDAVRFAYEHTPSGSVCLLSTASPSYTLWKNFEEKGAAFQLFVMQLAHATKTSSDHVTS